MPSLEQYIILAIILFLIGLFGFLTRRNLIVILISIEIMLNGLIVLFAAISHFTKDISGYIIVFFIIAMAAAEAAIGLSLVVLIYKRLKTVYSDEITTFKG
ncbi:NAD(P)H-quinone oxidoreductase subunit 4L [Thermodesulfobacterium geofontis OPF15]|jgi:NADH-quinone oxidoreductase subunit K|uniref:NADH-quinone oxidoreductase subunit K n=2 Tax=Thermodesulfobacterium geofontis TaxID=1295609 RepID=F8C252_THEGP|nr:NADH-quinone oxidoreductase subunit NuoK [Thermodesulfobacterium geofontis]AEH22209.1 NAD(P)H-quinone oxidoreductase subunit 4L [Thermodesulfobacterium geofontis OPF15]